MSSNSNPRDTYASLEALWISKPTYLLRRLQLEQRAIEQFDLAQLQQAHAYMKYQEARLARQLRDLRAIDNIVQQIIEGYLEQQQERQPQLPVPVKDA